MYKTESLDLVYRISALMGKKIGPLKAVLIVAEFEHEELERICKALTKLSICPKKF